MYMKYSSKVMKKISNFQISSGSTNHGRVLVIFAGIVLKLEKVGLIFSSFNPCPSLPSIGTNDRNQFKLLGNNKTDPLFLELY